MHVGEEHGRAENDRHDDKEAPQKIVLPEDQRHKEGKSGMAREKEISLECQQPIKTVARVQAARQYPRWINSLMRQVYEESPEDNKERDRLHAEEKIFRTDQKQTTGKYPEEYRAAHDKETEVDDGKIIQKEIALIAGAERLPGRIVARAYLDDEGEADKQKTQIQRVFALRRPEPSTMFTEDVGH